MSETEVKRFKEFVSKFSNDNLVGWQSAIAFILPMHEVQTRLGNRLLAMYHICDEVLIDPSRKE